MSVGFSTVDRGLNQYKIVVPLFGAAYAAPNIGATILYLFSSTNVYIISLTLRSVFFINIKCLKTVGKALRSP